MKTSFHVVNGTEDTRDCVGSLRPRKYIYLLSKDAKPVADVHNGDVAFEMDTRKTFIFDEEGKKWWPL